MMHFEKRVCFNKKSLTIFSKKKILRLIFERQMTEIIFYYRKTTDFLITVYLNSPHFESSDMAIVYKSYNQKIIIDYRLRSYFGTIFGRSSVMSFLN